MLLNGKALSALMLLAFLPIQLVLGQSNSDASLQATISNVTSYLLLDDESGSVDPEPNGDVVAILESLTRVDGVSPETVYFSAQGSTCSDCNDIFGLGTEEADAWSELAYHFNFDDSDSGNFATTSNPRNQQIGSAPRAAHTFHCYGPSDPNWDTTNERCEFDIGVRVQAKDGDYDDAFIQINIQPLYGAGGYYADADITCVSSTSDFSWCPHSDGSRQLTDVPDLGDWDNQLVIIDNDGATYSDICMGAEEKNAVAVAYGPNLNPGIARGTRPVIPQTTLAARTSTSSCNSVHNATSITALADDMPERDGNGNLIDGFGFGQKVVGMKIGRAINGMTSNFVSYHDNDLDWSSSGTYSGEFDVADAAGFCTPRNGSGPIACNSLPYLSFMMITDNVIASNNSNLAFINMSCFGCGFVNSVVMGTSFNRADEHNLRLNGSYASIFSNNYFQGNHNGDGGGKSGLTVRPFDSGGGGTNTGGLHNLSKDPEDLSGSDFIRGTSASSEYFNRYNVAHENLFNNPTQDAISENSFRMGIGGYFTAMYGNEFQSYTGADGGIQNSAQWGRYNTVRATSWNAGATGDLQELTWYAVGTYHDCSDIYAEDTPRTGGPQCANFVTNTPVLSLPSAPGS